MSQLLPATFWEKNPKIAPNGVVLSLSSAPEPPINTPNRTWQHIRSSTGCGKLQTSTVLTLSRLISFSKLTSLHKITRPEHKPVKKKHTTDFSASPHTRFYDGLPCDTVAPHGGLKHFVPKHVAQIRGSTPPSAGCPNPGASLSLCGHSAPQPGTAATALKAPKELGLRVYLHSGVMLVWNLGAVTSCVGLKLTCGGSRLAEVLLKY